MLLTYYPSLALILEALQHSKPRIYLVGGALRDYFLGRRGVDFDFAVEKGSIALGRRLARRIKGSFVLLDKERGCARVVKTIGGQIFTFDFADWRAVSIQKDLDSRDFTVNALAWDFVEHGPQPDKVLEAKGARRDLKAGVVRMVSPRVFKDDPLRLLRAFALQAALGFRMDARTLAQIKKDAHLISQAAAERIREELFKVLTSPRAAESFESMDKAGLLPQVLPQITVMYGVYQGGYHHLDVWRHSLEVLRQLEKIMEKMASDEKVQSYLQEIIGGHHTRAALLKMAALLHDIGKPETKRQAAGRMTFHGHEYAGEKITRQAAKQLKLSVKERYFLENAVRLHLRPGYLSNFKRPSAKAVFRFMRDAGQEAASLAILAMADQAATRGRLTTKGKALHHAKTCRMLIDRFFVKQEHKPKERLLTGHDLIKVLKLKPSPVFGMILAKIEEEAALGKIKTKQEALDLAQKCAAARPDPN